MATAQEIEKLIVRLIGDATSYQTMLRNAQASTLRTASVIEAAGRRIEAVKIKLLALGAAFTAAGTSMRRMGRSLSLFVTAPLLAIGLTGVIAFGRFNQAMTESTSIMQVTTAQTEEMHRAAIELSADGKVLQSPKELAESYFFLASASKNAAQSMALLPKVSAFATAGAFDMALATDLLTDAQSALKLSSKDVAEDTRNLTRVSDVLVKANTLANASVQQFSTALTSKAGAAIAAFGKDVEEGVSVLAALADQGIKAELAGNALDRVLRLLSKGALENAKAHNRLGFSVFDSSGAMRNMGDIIENLEQILGPMSTKMKAATLDQLGFAARVQGVILPLLGTSKAIRRYEKELRNAGGTTKDVADKQMKSFANQMKILKNQFTVVAIEIGEVLAPMILRVNRVFKQAIGFWRGLNKEFKRLIVIIGLVVGSLAPLLLVLGVLATAVGTVIAGLTAIGSFLLANLPVIVTLGIALAGIWMTFGTQIRRGIAEARRLFVGFIRNVEHNVRVLVGWLTSVWVAVKNFFVSIWETAKAIAEKAMEGIGAVLGIDVKKLPDQFLNAITKIIGFFWNIQENVKLLGSWLKNNWWSILVDIATIVSTARSNLGKNFELVFKFVARVIGKVMGFILKIVSNFVLNELPVRFAQGIVRLATDPRLAAAIKRSGKVLKGLLTGVFLQTRGQVDELREFGVKLGAGITEGAKAEDLDELFADIGKLKDEAFLRVFEEIPLGFDDKATKQVSGLRSILEGLPALVSEPLKLLLGLPSAEDLGFKLGEPAKKAGEEAGKAMGEGIANEAQTALDAMKIDPVRVPITFGVVPAIEVGTLEHLQLLSGLPVGPQVQAAASQNVRARREAVEAARAARRAPIEAERAHAQQRQAEFERLFEPKLEGGFTKREQELGKAIVGADLRQPLVESSNTLKEILQAIKESATQGVNLEVENADLE